MLPGKKGEACAVELVRTVGKAVLDWEKYRGAAREDSEDSVLLKSSCVSVCWLFVLPAWCAEIKLGEEKGGVCAELLGASWWCVLIESGLIAVVVEREGRRRKFGKRST